MLGSQIWGQSNRPIEMLRRIQNKGPENYKFGENNHFLGTRLRIISNTNLLPVGGCTRACMPYYTKLTRVENQSKKNQHVKN